MTNTPFCTELEKELLIPAAEVIDIAVTSVLIPLSLFLPSLPLIPPLFLPLPLFRFASVACK